MDRSFRWECRENSTSAATELRAEYLRRPDLTAEKFVPHPFSTAPGARLYRSGDLARYLSDGNIDLLGRMDQQVKVRGFRIELGEIEAVLAEHAEVRESVVVIREDSAGDKRLVAYVVAGPQLAGDLRSWLRERLPEYFIPSLLSFSTSYHSPANGKVDRRALPRPSTVRIRTPRHSRCHALRRKENRRDLDGRAR
jgi:acyl-coenzyme A synthetase/AMP-(fatty) acid ligase